MLQGAFQRIAPTYELYGRGVVLAINKKLNMNLEEAASLVKKYMQEKGFDNNEGCILSVDSPVSTETSWIFDEKAIYVPEGEYIIKLIKYLVNKKNKFCSLPP